MELGQNNTIPYSHTISKEETYPIYKDYRHLLALGMEHIAQYSGSIWTNYNDSDPGITQLQMFCYALTELGNKADLSLETLLAEENNEINYSQQFHYPHQILPTNPVTLPDFIKAILNEVPELKQVYITNHQTSISKAIFQTSLEVKPEYISNVSNDPTFSNYLSKRVKTYLCQHANLGMVFTTPQILVPTLLQVNGSLSITTEMPAEKILATIIFRANEVLSPYPNYKSYNTLLDEGKTRYDLLEGPYLSGGYIPDSQITDKKSSITSDELSAALLEIPEVIQVDSLLLSNAKDKFGIKINSDRDQAPFFSVESFLTATIMTHGKPIGAINQNKVKYYLTQLIPQQKSSNLKSCLPQGSYRPFEKYYSIQNDFPGIYQLKGNGPKEPTHQAQVKQLKAYLCIFEQYMANYLAQLKNIPNLLSFQSGRTDSNLTETTFYAQPLYTVPNISKVLSGVNGYQSFQASSQGVTDWMAYQSASNNPYVQQIQNTPECENLNRKQRALEHLLARYGMTYNKKTLRYTNPGYGQDTIAEVEYLTQTLKLFPILSTNRSRTYFHKHSNNLISGLELNLGNELGLTSFYQGIVEAIEQSLLHQEGLSILYYEGETVQALYPANAVTGQPDKTKNGKVEVCWNDQPFLLFVPEGGRPTIMNTARARKFLEPYLSTLSILSSKYYGCILVDGSALASFVQWQWDIQSTESKTIYAGEPLSLSHISQQLGYLQDNTLSLEIRSANGGKEFEIGVVTSTHWHYILGGISSETQAKELLSLLNDTRKTGFFDTFQIKVADSASRTGINAHNMIGNIIAFFPEWLSLFHQEPFRIQIKNQLQSLAPVSACSHLEILPLPSFSTLLKNYSDWMSGVQNRFIGENSNPESRMAAVQLSKLFSEQKL